MALAIGRSPSTYVSSACCRIPLLFTQTPAGLSSTSQMKEICVSKDFFWQFSSSASRFLFWTSLERVARLTKPLQKQESLERAYEEMNSTNVRAWDFMVNSKRQPVTYHIWLSTSITCGTSLLSRTRIARRPTLTSHPFGLPISDPSMATPSSRILSLVPS